VPALNAMNHTNDVSPYLCGNIFEVTHNRLSLFLSLVAFKCANLLKSIDNQKKNTRMFGGGYNNLKIAALFV
jgi:hypothetical protein